MVHIVYDKGPEILKDMSKEVFDSITKDLTYGRCYNDIMLDYDVNVPQLTTIDSIRLQKLKRCCFCGMLFKSASSRKITCNNEHYLPCIDCGDPVKVNESYAMYIKAGGRRCQKCRGKQIGLTRSSKSEEEKNATVAKQQATMIAKYGAATPLQVPELKAKIQATVKEKYGVDNLSQSAEIQKRIRQNSLQRFGVSHYSNNPETRKRMKEGMISKYGVEYAQQNTEIQEKTKKTNLQKYGCENVFQNEQVRETFVSNHLAKYGVEWPHQRPELIEQVKQANQEKYGAPMYPVCDDFLKTVVVDPSKFSNYKAFMEDPEKFISSNYSSKPSVYQLSKDIGVTDTTVYDKLISVNKRYLATEYRSSMETQIAEYLISLDPSLEIEFHNRIILNGRELDIYLPALKIGIECNPTHTHNSSFEDPWGGLPKDYRYHANKSIDCIEQGVFLFHVFGYEWTNRKDIILSQLQNMIGANTRKVFARQCYISEINYKEAAEFLDCNHRQGNSSSKIRLGLRVKETNELVSLMTFGSMRPGIGKKSNQSNNEWELVRFCNLKRTTVVGGASKLLKHFIQTIGPYKIVSFSDIAHTKGNLYCTLNFHKVSISDPGYVWVNLKDDSYLTRVSCQKSNLPNIFPDVSISDIKNKTENQIMTEHNYARVYDSGVIRWEWTPENNS